MSTASTVPLEAVGAVLDPAELKALSMPSGLRLLLCAELDIFLSLASMKGANMSVRFPPLGSLHRKLVSHCANRFRLQVTDAADGPVVHGCGTIPLLRYVDFLPGRLHVDEVLACLGIAAPSNPRCVPGSTGDAFAACVGVEAGAYACKEDDPQALHGLGHYLSLDMGLPLATHGHLVQFTVEGKDSNEAVRAFQRFSGWDKFDLRWLDERTQKQGVLVMPTVVDAAELLGRYEDCESGSDETYAFGLRPVAPLIAVPYMDDSQVKKLRTAHWPTIVEFWQRFAPSRATVVVSNFSDRASLEDVLKLFDGATKVCPLVDATMVVDSTPTKSRRIFLQFAHVEGARAGLECDGRNFHGSSLRVAVAPPYASPGRRGIVLATLGGKSPMVSPALGASKSPPPLPVSVDESPSGGGAASGPSREGSGVRGRSGSKKPLGAERPESAGKDRGPNSDAKQQQAPANSSFSKGRRTPPPPPAGVDLGPEQLFAVAPSLSLAAAAGAHPSPQQPPSAAPDRGVVSNTTPKVGPAPVASSSFGRGMNVEAKEFVPKFGASPSLGAAQRSPLLESALPPPYPGQLPPPPAYPGPLPPGTPPTPPHAPAGAAPIYGAQPPAYPGPPPAYVETSPLYQPEGFGAVPLTYPPPIYLPPT